MQNYSIALRPIAFKDLDSIGDYITNTLMAPESAEKLIDKIFAQFERLKCFPFSGNILKSEIPLEETYRTCIVDNYIIFYIIDEDNQLITIMRILFGSSDYIQLL